ncbi:unnamed protein product [Staurois parvus]|uniref:Uncharacterized protein n=1 Tax=Staurois parvus TaxID=386267 RepID=A0ABN9DRW6_9NEOB|nr:unnamed protein product [Staurois parvus]
MSATNQCRLSVPVSATYECYQSVPPISASQYCLSVPYMRTAFQSPSVMSVNAHQ